MTETFQVILNYRREDSSGHAGRLYDALAERFGPEHVFMDIDTIEPGVDFSQVIERAVGSADAFLALIGQRWVSASDAKGNRRLDNPDDFVRVEIEAALRREDVRVIPVLVQEADMPSSEELPRSLAPFARRNALGIRDVSWRYDVDRLIQTLEKVAEEKRRRTRPTPAPPSRAPREPERGRFGRRQIAVAVAAAAALVVGAVVLAVILLGGGNGSPSDEQGGGPPGNEPRQGLGVFSVGDEIFTIGIDGTRTFLTRGSEPDWSPDGTEIALSRDGDIWVVDASGSGELRLTSAPEQEGLPDWSPDGTLIAFNREPSSEDPTFDILVTNADGLGEPENLTPGPDRSGAAPAWSSDGIVFQRQGVIWIIDWDGNTFGVERQLFRPPKYGAREPAWSPNGSEIALSVAKNVDESDIYVIDTNGNVLKRLTDGNVTGARSPTWSPEGDQIAFAAKDGIWIIRRDGTGLKPLIEGVDFQTPAWRPQ
jgi:TIR domain/WD40-like Beta Propeller Repeat